MSAPAQLRVRRLRDEAVLPQRQHPADAGLDLVAVEGAVLPARGGRATIGTGVAVEVPEGWAGLVCPRSGLAARHGIGIVNAPGVVDAGYRGELRVVLHNGDAERSFEVSAGDRIAQLVLVPVLLAEVVEADELAPAARNEAGFGSTGARG